MSFNNLKKLAELSDLDLTVQQLQDIETDISNEWGTAEEDVIKDIADDLKADPLKYARVHGWTLVRIGMVGVGAYAPEDTIITT